MVRFSRGACVLDDDGKTTVVSAFKPRSLELIERVASGQVASLVLTKRGRPAAVLLPVREQPVELWGALRKLTEHVTDADMTAPTEEVWAAERSLYSLFAHSPDGFSGSELGDLQDAGILHDRIHPGRTYPIFCCLGRSELRTRPSLYNWVHC